MPPGARRSASCPTLSPRTDRPGWSRAQSRPPKEEDELEVQEECGFSRAARRRARARRRGLRRVTTAAGRPRRFRRHRARRSSTRATATRTTSSRPTSRCRAPRARRREQIVAAIRHELDAARLEGRRLQHRLPVVRRRDRPGRQVGLGQVLAERERLRRERRGDRRHRHVQLGLRGDHHPGAEPGAGRRHRDDVPGQHVPVPDGQPAGRL